MCIRVYCIVIPISIPIAPSRSLSLSIHAYAETYLYLPGSYSWPLLHPQPNCRRRELSTIVIVGYSILHYIMVVYL